MDMKMTLAEMVENDFGGTHKTRRVKMRATPYHSCRLFESENFSDWRTAFGAILWLVNYAPDTPSTVHAKCSVIAGETARQLAEIIIDNPTTKFKTHSDMMNAIFFCAKSHGKECFVTEQGSHKKWRLAEEFDAETSQFYIAFNEI